MEQYFYGLDDFHDIQPLVKALEALVHIYCYYYYFSF